MTALMTKALAGKLPKLYETESVPLAEKVVHARYFHPSADWEWYAIEYDGTDICFGLVIGFEAEFGYFSLKELGSLNIPAERDLNFQPTVVHDLPAYHGIVA